MSVCQIKKLRKIRKMDFTKSVNEAAAKKARTKASEGLLSRAHRSTNACENL